MHILKIIAPVFGLIVVGVVLRRIRFLKDADVEILNKLTFYIALPSLVAYNLLDAELSELFDFRIILGMYLAMIVLMILTYTLGTLLKFDWQQKAVLMMATLRGNMAYMGLPILMNAFGEGIVGKVSVIIGFLSPGMYILAVISAAVCEEHAAAEKMSLQELVKGMVYSIVKTPIVVAVVIAIVLSSLQVPIPALLMQILASLKQMAFPIALLGIGASISMERLKGDLSITLLVAVFKLVVLSCIGYAILLWLGVGEFDRTIGTLLLAMPTAIITYVVADGLGADKELAASSIVMTTVVSSITISAWLYVLSWGLGVR